MTIYPSSNVVLYSGIPFSPEYTHTMYFSGLAAQTSFFNSWSNKATFENYTYVRDERILKVQPDGTGRSMWSYNYISFSNPDGSRFFGFIIDIDYINNNTYAVHFTIDLMQTFFPLCSINPCLVDREHVKSDNKGEHTEAEPFTSWGQPIYKCIASPVSNVKDVPTYTDAIKDGNGNPYPFSSMFGDVSLAAVIMANQNLRNLEGWSDADFQPREEITNAQLFGNIYNGMYFYAYWVNSTSDLGKISALIEWVNNLGQGDSILNIFMCPLGIFETSRRKDGILQHGIDCRIDVSNTSLGVYTPKNNKLYTYPYNYLYATNNEGNSAVYKFEYFDKYQQNFGSTFFAWAGQLAPGAVLGIFPRNYAGSLYYTDAMLTTSPYPLCAWSTDVYSAYIALNSGKIAAQQESLALQTRKTVDMAKYDVTSNTVGGILGVLGGNLNTGVSAIQKNARSMFDMQYALQEIDQQAKNISADFYDISVIPPQAHGNQSGDVLMSSGTKGIEFYQVYPNSESCKIIDDFFTLYGYHRGVVKVPEVTSRKNWNYVKTSGSNVSGAVPASAIQAINKIFDSGITFWHNISTYGNYNADNSIV